MSRVPTVMLVVVAVFPIPFGPQIILQLRSGRAICTGSAVSLQVGPSRVLSSPQLASLPWLPLRLDSFVNLRQRILSKY